PPPRRRSRRPRRCCASSAASTRPSPGTGWARSRFPLQWSKCVAAPRRPGREMHVADQRDGSSPGHGAMEDTPLMRELTRDHARRKQLEGLQFAAPDHTRIITVANQKGGVGKTSTTVNVAAALSMGGLNVLVIDADPQGNTSTALGIEHHAEVPSMYEVLVEGADLAEVIQPVPEMERLYCAPATINLSGAEIELVSLVARENRMRNAIRDLLDAREAAGAARLDYVIVDCPP